MLNWIKIIAGLDEEIKTAVWEPHRAFSYRELSSAADTNASSYLASVQQFRFSTTYPEATTSKQLFFESLELLQPKTLFEIDTHPNWIELRIFNFYPPLFRRGASILGSFPHVTVYLMLDSATISEIVAQNGNDSQLWGYEFLQKRGMPNLFQSGPGLFEFTIQLFRLDRQNQLLTLYFLAAERPNALVALFGRDWLFPSIKRLSKSESWLAPFAGKLVTQAENEMLRIHNRVHRELIDNLCHMEV